MNFKEEKYIVIKNIISKELANFLHEYFLIKKQVFVTFKESSYISKFNNDWGTSGDGQCPKSYSMYGDIAMDNLLNSLTDKISEKSGYDLFPTYSYGRVYEKGAELEKHTDRESCAISGTLCLGGTDVWPIYLKDVNEKEIEINLKQGDILLYSGCELEHWRNEFEGELCTQVFLHYNDKNGLDGDENKFDKRPHLGLPSFFKEDEL